MSGYRPSYTLSEDNEIIRYILDNDAQDLIKGTLMWKNLEKKFEENGTPRTFHSLKNRYLRTIACNLHDPRYNLTKEERQILEIANIPKTRKKPQPAVNRVPPVVQRVQTDKQRKTARKNKPPDDDDDLASLLDSSSDSDGTTTVINPFNMALKKKQIKGIAARISKITENKNPTSNGHASQELKRGKSSKNNELDETSNSMISDSDESDN